MRITLLIYMVLNSMVAPAQQLNFQAGNSTSKLIFRDENGNKLLNLQSTDNFFMSMAYRKTVFNNDRLFADLGLGYNRYGAFGSDLSVDNRFSWDLSYLGINLGLDYEFYRPGNFTFYGKVSVSPEFLIRGTQTINNQVYDLVGEDDFDTPMVFLRGGLGTQYRVSNLISMYVQYLVGKSYALKGDSEQLNLVSHNLGFGVLFNLSAASQSIAPEAPDSDQRLQQLEQKLQGQSQQIKALEVKNQQTKNLEQQIQAQELEMEQLKDNISKALFEVSPQGLQVYRSEGKVYVIMDNDLLFESGRWEVSPQGVKAVETLGVVLAENPESSILIEGHTDSRLFRGSGNIKDNWDLSTKRATAIVQILRRNPGMDPKRLTAAGRGEHDPKASNQTKEGQALNRRTEIIINPQLEKAHQLLEH